MKLLLNWDLTFFTEFGKGQKKKFYIEGQKDAGIQNRDFVLNSPIGYTSTARKSSWWGKSHWDCFIWVVPSDF